MRLKKTVITLLLSGAFSLVLAFPVLAAKPSGADQPQNPSLAQNQEANLPNSNANTNQDNSAPVAQGPLARLGHDLLRTVGGGETLSSANRGSPYVPLDSWIYPALDRLIGMGLVDSAFNGMRPWTRIACAEMVSEAQDKLDQPLDQEQPNEMASQIIDELAHEFRPEIDVVIGKANAPGNTVFRPESVYSRTEYISGTPLTDGYDFAQTQFNDFGRPYGQGWNTVNGLSAYGTYGRWVGYVRGEGQTAPSIPALPLSAREVVVGVNYPPYLPLPPSSPNPAVKQFELLDTYVGLTLSNWQLSFGRQSLWWGPGMGTSLELSDNIQPIDMIRINRTVPLQLPSVLGLLGSMRLELFLGRLSGYQFIYSPLGLVGQWGQALQDQPFIHGQNITFKPTTNFEFGFYRTTVFGGEGYPFTLHRLIASVFDLGNSPAGSANKPGKRTSGLDFSYRLPHLRNWVTFYADGYINDEFSPIAYPTWSAWHPGLYFSHLPKLSRLDFRVEGVYTDVPVRGGSNAPGSFFSDVTWRSGYTNNGYLIGSWIGRGGQGAQALTNYWFNARSRLQLNFRHQKVSKDFIPQGGTLTDFGIHSDYWFRHRVGLGASVQYERWLFPVIQAEPQTNVSTSIEIQIQPQTFFRLNSQDRQIIQ